MSDTEEQQVLFDTSADFEFDIHDKRQRTIPSLIPNTDMAELGFKNVMINVVTDGDIDGALIKSIEHGMGMSMLRFFDVGYGYLQELNSTFHPNNELKQSVYRLNDTDYFFDLSGDFVTGKVMMKNSS